MTYHKDYVMPQVELLETLPVSAPGVVLCASKPEDGGIEDIDYETW